MTKLKKVLVTVDFNSQVTRADTKISHLHKVKAAPNPEGNRAERREAKKLKGKK